MKLGYTILYVDDVPASVEAWEAAFGLERSFVHESGVYAELSTGDTTLSFAGREFGKTHFTDERTIGMFDQAPARFEIGLVTEDVDAAWTKATGAGMEAVVPPQVKPWGQTVAWVRDADGILIELATPM
ncbi:MAG: VOC family protein [Proteobacteria bacterium]|nr:VOC family protein [Pseudomonadota bacterium]